MVKLSEEQKDKLFKLLTQHFEGDEEIARRTIELGHFQLAVRYAGCQSMIISDLETPDYTVIDFDESSLESVMVTLFP